MEQGEIIIVNPSDHDWTRCLFLMTAGCYALTKGYVWANSLDKAFELWVEWIDDNEPDLLTTLDESDLKEAAKELGLNWPTDDEEEQFKIEEHAAVDLTFIGHTTLDNGNYIHAEEWGGSEVTDQEIFNSVKESSIEESDD